MKLIITKKRLMQWSLWLFVIIPIVPFIIGTLGYLIYAFWPRDFSAVTQLELNNDTTHITISAHGVKDNENSWSLPLQTELITWYKNLEINAVQHLSIAWQPYSDNALICSVTGKKLGYEIGQKIAKLPNIIQIHAIGHSCGSFVVYGLCQGIKASNTQIKVHTTYLDPVSIYAGIFWQYGVNNFGRCSDFSDSYIDTEDTVPASNKALLNSYTFDVTDLRQKSRPEISPHNWPTRYYLEKIKVMNTMTINNDVERLLIKYPKGGTQKMHN